MLRESNTLRNFVRCWLSSSSRPSPALIWWLDSFSGWMSHSSAPGCTSVGLGIPASLSCGARAVLVNFAAICLSLTAFAAELGVSVANGRVGSGGTTLEAALIQAYQNNPQLNAQRAATRAVDEAVPTALSGYRPRATGTASITENYLEASRK